MMQKLANDLVKLTKDILQEDASTKVASTYDKSWWNEFLKQFKRYVEKTNFVDYQIYFDVEGEADWQFYNQDDFELKLKGFDVELKDFDEKLKISDVFKKLNITKDIDVSPFLKRTPLQDKLEDVLQEGIKMKLDIHVNGEQFNSLGDDYDKLGLIDTVVYFAIEGKYITLDLVEYDETKVKKKIADIILDKEEPKESDYPSRDDYRRKAFLMNKQTLASDLVKLAKDVLAADLGYRKNDKRSLWIKVSSTPVAFLTVDDVSKEAKRMEKLMNAQLKKIKELTDAHIGVAKNTTHVEGNEQYKWVSKTAQIGVRGLDEAERLFDAVKELGYEERYF